MQKEKPSTLNPILILIVIVFLIGVYSLFFYTTHHSFIAYRRAVEKIGWHCSVESCTQKAEDMCCYESTYDHIEIYKTTDPATANYIYSNFLKKCDTEPKPEKRNGIKFVMCYEKPKHERGTWWPMAIWIDVKNSEYTVGYIKSAKKTIYDFFDAVG